MNRGKEDISMEIDKRCFKIDRPNAFAMIEGYRKNGKINRILRDFAYHTNTLQP
jgi:hypothetical protein